MRGKDRSAATSSIRRLIALFALLSVVPLALLTFVSVRLASDALLRNAASSVHSNAEASAVLIERELRGLTDLVSSYAQRPTLIAAMRRPSSYDRRSIRLHLTELQSSRPGIATAFLADPQGILIDIVPATPSIVGKDFGFRDWYKGVTSKDGPYVSEAYTSLAAGHPRVVAAASLVRSPRGDRKALGIVVAAYSLDTIQGFVDRFAASQGVTLSVTDQRGVLVAAPGVSLSELISLRDDPGVTAALDGRSGVGDMGGSTLWAYSPVPGLGWTVTASVPSREALAGVGRLRSTVVTLAAVLGLVLLGGLLLLVRALRERQRAEDAAERSRVEAEQARADAERANQAKSEFLSRMSHELRTPLNAILGFGQLLEVDDLSQEQFANVGFILRGGRHLLGLINEILDLSRIEAGHLSLSLEPVRVGDALADAIELVRPLVAERGITLDVDPGKFGERHVLADRLRFRQVLINLLSNAVKYNTPGGAVTVSCEEEPAGTLAASVSDTGPGISPDDLDRLFVPFERLGAEGSEVEGTGLGLALSKHLVEAMGGTLSVQSAVGRGSTFRVELPLTEAPVEEASGAVNPEPWSGAPIEATVLYVEDNPSNLELVERILASRPGVSLLTAMEGLSGVAIARESRPDLILLDRHLPDIPGEEVLRLLREDAATRDIPVIILSADATPAAKEQLLAAGAYAYLTKPLDVKRLLRVIDEVLLQPPTDRLAPTIASSAAESSSR